MEKQPNYELIVSVSSALGLLAIAFASFPKWMRRKWFMKEFNATCQGCGKKWDDGWMLEFHHIIPESQGGKQTLDNADLLCQKCHSKAHRQMGDRKSVRMIKRRLRRTGGRNHKYKDKHSRV